MVFKSHLVVERFLWVFHGFVIFCGFHLGQAFRLPSMGAIHRRSWIHDGVSRLKTSGTRAWMELSLFQCLAPTFLKMLHRCKWASFPFIVIAQVAMIFWGATATMRLWASHPIMRNWYNMVQPSPTKDYRWSFGNWWFPLLEPGSSCKHPRAMYKNCSVAGAAHSFAQFDGMLHGWKQIPVGLLDSHGVSSVSTEWRQHPCLPTLWVLVRVWFVKSQYKKIFYPCAHGSGRSRARLECPKASESARDACGNEWEVLKHSTKLPKPHLSDTVKSLAALGGQVADSFWAGAKANHWGRHKHGHSFPRGATLKISWRPGGFVEPK